MPNVKLSVIIPLVLCSCAANRSAVTSNDKQVAATQVVEEIVMDEEVAVVAEDRGTPSPSGANALSFDAVKNIQFNARYGVAYNINDRYDYYWEKNSSNRYNAVGVVDKDGNVILPHIFSRGNSTSNAHELLLSINGASHGLYNLNELRWTIPPVYHELMSLGNNVFAAKKDNKWGLVDNNNTVIGGFQWKQVDKIYNLENYLMVSLEDMWGIYSIMERKLTVPAEYTSLRKLDRENYFLVKKGSKANVVDINDKPLFKHWYDEVRVSTMNGEYFIVRESNKYGVVDRSEKVIVPITYLEFSESSYSDGSYMARNKDGKYGFMLADGRVTLPFNYDNVKKGYNNNVISIQNGKCGLVRVNSGLPTEIVTCEFDNIREGSKTFIVEKGGKYGLLNQYGKPITEVEYTSLESLRDNYYDEMVIYLAQKGKGYFLLNEQGRVMNETEFAEISPLFRKGQNSYYASTKFTYMKVKGKGGKYGLVDKVGKVILEPQFDEIIAEDDNIVVVKSKDKCGLYSLLTKKQLVDFAYDLIIRSNNSYLGFSGKEIDFLSIKSDQVTKMSTISK